MNNITKESLDIIVIAGQSNAEGNGISSENRFETRDKVYEMVDANKYYFDFSNPDKPELKIILPVQSKIQCLQDKFGETRIVSDFAFTFVDSYINSSFFNKDRKVLVIKAGVGGTGFCKNEWGTNSILYKRMCDMIDKALSFNKNNKIVAMLWHQGECDAFENRAQNSEIIKQNYLASFLAQFNDFKNKYNYDLPIIMGEFVNEWADLEENKESTNAIESALKEAAKELGNSRVISSESLLSNNQEFSNGDNIHFSKNSLNELGKRYFEAYKQLRNN